MKALRRKTSAVKNMAHLPGITPTISLKMENVTSFISDKIPSYLEKGLSQDQSSSAVLTVIVAGLVTATLYSVLKNIKLGTVLLFCWNCFLKPFLPSFKRRSDRTSQQQALEAFYEAQAKIYDSTRSTLLKGREDSLRILVSHLRRDKDLVWIDIGGGTGYNVEQMISILPLTHFKAIYIVDLSPSLLDVARHRFENQGFTNVHCMLADACTFMIPEQQADIITFSYSLSMIPTFHSAIDHASDLLKIEGLICCVDFGIQSSANTVGKVNTVGGLAGRHVPWVLRTFWRAWFEADRVFLDPARRDYLEYRFGTIKSLNLYNKILGKIPYYIWLGCDKNKSSSLLYRINALATESPYLAPQDVPTSQALTVKTSKSHEAALSNESKNLPYPSMYYQNDIYRVYYDEQKPIYRQFKDQYIYAFTWEDPQEDNQILHFTKDDTVLAITSAGDNILSYASLPSPPRRIHCVDLNPCQGHLLELKLAAFKSLSREEIWQMFGVGKIDNFKAYLLKMSSHMSSNAFQFWYKNGPKAFATNGNGLYFTGFSKWPLKFTRYIFQITGMGDFVDELCSAKTMKQQKLIWQTKLRPKLLNPILSTLLIGNPLFLWKALGVPANQASLMGSSVFKYLADTLDPVINKYMVSSDNYFYYLCLKGKYSKNNCPDYLTKSAFRKFTSKNSPLSNIRIHTDYLNDVFSRMTRHSLTIAIIMDHMDWFSKERTEANEEIRALDGALAPGGRVMLRSASKAPWYIRNFEEFGFKCRPAAVRENGTAIDRVNMYASTWICEKPREKTRNMSTLEL